MRRLILLVALFTGCTPWSRDTAPPHDFILANARIVDGTGAPVRLGNVWVKNGIIVAMDRAPQGDVIDLHGKTLMPGLIDLHCHFGGSPGSMATWAEFSPDLWPSKFKAFLYWGVLTVRSLCDDKDRFVESNPRPSIFWAGPAFTAPEGHPVELFRIDPELRRRCTVEVNDPDKARDEVRRVAAMKVDVIKCVLQEMSQPGRRLEPKVLAAIVGEAHRLGLGVVCHVAGKRDAIDAIAAGVDGIEHPPEGFDAEVHDLLVAKKVFWVPTLSVVSAFAHVGEAAGLDTVRDGIPRAFVWSLKNPGMAMAMMSQAKARMRRRLDQAFAAVRLMNDHLELVACGSDCGNAQTHFGLGAVEELELLVQAGLTPLQAIRVGTSNSARHLGTDTLGTIAVGKRAELLIVDGRPDERIEDLRKLSAIVHAGAVTPRSAFSFGDQYSMPDTFIPPEPMDDWNQWRPYTDVLWGGSSELHLAREDGTLHVTGRIGRSSLGSMAQITRPLLQNGFQTADISRYSGVSFRATGPGKFQLIVSITPKKQTSVEFDAPAEWKEFRLSWQDLKVKSRQIIGLSVGPAVAEGTFDLRLADFRFY